MKRAGNLIERIADAGAEASAGAATSAASGLILPAVTMCPRATSPPTLTWYLESCAAAGGCVPHEPASYLPWNLTPERRKLLAIGTQDTS